MSRSEDDDGSQTVRPSPIVQTFIRQTDLLYILTFEDGTRLETTWNHPFYVEGKGWTEAKDLKSGDRSLIAETGETLELMEVTQDHLGGEVNVYNFQVEGDHTYFVGEGRLWVHNQTPYVKGAQLLEKAVQEAAVVCEETPACQKAPQAIVEGTVATFVVLTTALYSAYEWLAGDDDDTTAPATGSGSEEKADSPRDTAETPTEKEQRESQGDNSTTPPANSPAGGNDNTIKETYNSIKDSPKYPAGFTDTQNGTQKVNVKDEELLSELRKVESGKWNKVYKDGYDENGNQISIHYFQSSSGKVFDVKVKDGWSNLHQY